MSNGNGKNGRAPRMADPVFRRRLAIRAALVAALVALGAFSMVIGKGHTIVLDDMAAKDGSYEAIRACAVKVGRGKDIEMTRGVRELVTVTGQRFKLAVDWLDGSAPLVKSIDIPFGQEYVIVYLPRLKAGIEPWIEPFFPFDQVPDEPAAPAPLEPAAPKP